MVLRKHLTSAEVTNIHKPLSERIIEFTFKTAVPSKELETMSLIVELLPNAPNLILLDAERRVLSSFVPLTPQHGIGEYEPYAYPGQGDKLQLEHLLEDTAGQLEELNAESLVSRVAGIGPVFARELAARQNKSRKPWIAGNQTHAGAGTGAVAWRLALHGFAFRPHPGAKRHAPASESDSQPDRAGIFNAARIAHGCSPIFWTLQSFTTTNLKRDRCWSKRNFQCSAICARPPGD